MKQIMLLTGLLILSPALVADQDDDESRLLKSWGFQFDAQGQLIFNSTRQESSKYQPWTPQFSADQASKPGTSLQKPLDPLVITSKNKN